LQIYKTVGRLAIIFSWKYLEKTLLFTTTKKKQKKPQKIEIKHKFRKQLFFKDGLASLKYI
jgi:hypothetical protein